MKLIEKSYKVIAYVVAIILFILMNYFNITKQISNGTIHYILLGVFSVIVFVIVNKYMISKMKDRTIKIIISVLLLVFLLLEILSAIYFRVEYNWDFKWVMDTAKQVAQTGSITRDSLNYYKMFPNNIAAVGMVAVAMKVFFSQEIGAYVLNILFVFLAALLGVIAAYKMKGPKLALNVTLLMVLCSPFYLYTPIIYTDTLSVMFPVLTLLLWLLFKESKEKENKVKQYVYWTLMTIAAFIGFTLKPVAAIVLVAIIIDSILTHQKNLKFIILTVILFVGMNFIYNSVVYNVVLKDSKKNNIVHPYTHWIMMGLNKPESEGGTSIGWGAYSYEDSVLTEGQPTYDQKVETNLRVTKERLKDFGVGGYLDFLKNKFIYVWEDPTFYVFKKIGWGTIHKDTTLYQYVIGDKSGEFCIPYLEIFYTMLMLFIIIGAIGDIAKEKNREIRIMEISVIGIVMFLLIWEARSRYIYFLIPILCMLGAGGILQASEIQYKKKYQEMVTKIRKIGSKEK